MPRVKPAKISSIPAAEVRFIEPMYALAVKNLPEGKDWLYEVKCDGYRCFAVRRTFSFLPLLIPSPRMIDFSPPQDY